MMSTYLLVCVFVAVGVSNIEAQSCSNVYCQQPDYPRDCKEAYEKWNIRDGVYLIKPDGVLQPFNVYCKNSIDGGGWTVFQRRVDGSVNFYRSWNEYKNGFGFLSTEFWLGNDKLSYLTNQKRYELRIDFVSRTNYPSFAKYNLFRISDEGTKYRLVDVGEFDSSSTARFDALKVHRNQSFSTFDRNNCIGRSNEAVDTHGAWWFGGGVGNCRLNSLYNAGSNELMSILWADLPGGRSHIKYTEMKVRPIT